MRRAWALLLGTLALAAVAGCGVATGIDWDAAELSQHDSPIVGGTPTQEFDSVVLLEAGANRCTGTLIAPDVVLTAAHCVDDHPGEVRVLWCDDCANGWCDDMQTTADVHPYPHFNPDTMYGDLAVVVLPRPAPTRPIPIYRDEPRPGWRGVDSPTFVGFGTTQAVASDGGVKRQVQIPVDEWDSAFLYYEDSQRQTCFGDSGGPALVEHDGAWAVAGVNSYGDDHCASFGVSVRVDAFQDWLDAFTGGYGAGDVPTVPEATPAQQGGGPGFGGATACSAAPSTGGAAGAPLVALILVYLIDRRHRIRRR